MEENGQTLTQTKVSRSSQAAGVLVGGALLGPTGMIIGGLSGSKNSTSTEIITALDLQVMVDDLDNPLWSIRYFSGASPRNGITFLTAREHAQHWHALLSVIVRQSSPAAAGELLNA